MPGSRMMTQVAEPFFAGKILPEQQEAFDLNIAAFEATRAALVPGATWRDVETAALAVADGTDWQVSFLLHGGFDGPALHPGRQPRRRPRRSHRSRHGLHRQAHGVPTRSGARRGAQPRRQLGGHGRGEGRRRASDWAPAPSASSRTAELAARPLTKENGSDLRFGKPILLFGAARLGPAGLRDPARQKRLRGGHG